MNSTTDSLSYIGKRRRPRAKRAAGQRRIKSKQVSDSDNKKAGYRKEQNLRGVNSRKHGHFSKCPIPLTSYSEG
jgi:hypothetical protein